MAGGEGPGEEDDLDSDSPGGEAPDAPPNLRSKTDPSVDGLWLRRRTLSARVGAPRMSTVVLIVTFCAVFVLYVVLHRGA
ncbi:hypothetical protein [Nocardia sp. CNY236]|uniref:hypothetical protein n=1 Tax=Nocardia sp. CNY236 TaxID=1169152 RepID=UPI00040F717F|nr:hypothetical protein [Nocardia sp. CNY236]